MSEVVGAAAATGGNPWALAIASIPLIAGLLKGDDGGYTPGQKKLHTAQAAYAAEQTKALERRAVIDRMYQQPTMDMVYQHVGGVMNQNPRAIYAPGIFTPDFSGREGAPVERIDPPEEEKKKKKKTGPAAPFFPDLDVSEWGYSGAPKYPPPITINPNWGVDAGGGLEDWLPGDVLGEEEESIVEKVKNWAQDLGIADVSEQIRTVLRDQISSASNMPPFDPYLEYDLPSPPGNINIKMGGEQGGPGSTAEYQARLEAGFGEPEIWQRPSPGPEGNVGITPDDVLEMYQSTASAQNIASNIGISGGEGSGSQIFNRREDETQRYNDAAIASGAARMVTPEQYANISARGNLGAMSMGRLTNRNGEALTDENGNLWIIPDAWAGPSGISWNEPEWFSTRSFEWPPWLEDLATGEDVDIETLLNTSQGYASAPYTAKPPGWAENFEAVQRYHEGSRPRGGLEGVLSTLGLGGQSERFSVDDVVDYIRYGEGEGTEEGRRELWEKRQDERSGGREAPAGTLRDPPPGLVSDNRLEEDLIALLADNLTTTESVSERQDRSPDYRKNRPPGDTVRRKIKRGDWVWDADSSTVLDSNGLLVYAMQENDKLYKDRNLGIGS
jgi:hypothetical protein